MTRTPTRRDPIFAILDALIDSGWGNVPRTLTERIQRENGCLPDKPPARYTDAYYMADLEHLTYEDEIGKQYHRWTVIGVGVYKKSRQRLECRCECGTVRLVDIYALHGNQSRSCGCLRQEWLLAEHYKAKAAGV